MSVYYRCKICGDEHPSPIVFRDEESFDKIIFLGESFQCPVKEESAIYDKDDMFWQD